MKYLVVAALCIFSSLHGRTSPISEDNILGTFSLALREPSNTSAHLSLPIFIILSKDHTVEFIFDGEAMITSQCETSWILKGVMLSATLDCTSIFPNLKAMVMDLDLSNATPESLLHPLGVD